MPNATERNRTMPNAIKQRVFDWAQLERDRRGGAAYKLAIGSELSGTACRLVRWLFESPDVEVADEIRRSVRVTTYAAICAAVGVDSKDTAWRAVQALQGRRCLAVETIPDRDEATGRIRRRTRLTLSWPRFFAAFGRRSGGVRAAFGPNAKEKSPPHPLLKKNQEPPPPPLTRDPGPGGDDWQAAEEAAAAVLVDWFKPVSVARKHGVSPDYVLRVISYYRAAEPAFGPGALHRRLCRAHPTLDPSQGWPLPRYAPRQRPRMDATRQREKARNLLARQLRTDGATVDQIDQALAAAGFE